MSFASSRVACLRFAVGLAIITVTAAGSPRAADSIPGDISVIQTAVGDSVDLAGRVVLVDFWASWCVPCRASFPWMQTLHDRLGKRGFLIVTVNVDRDPAAAKAFLHKMNAALPVVFDPKGDLAKRYHLEVMPTSFIYGRDGKLRAHHEGFHPDDAGAREAEISKLVEEKTE